MDIEDREKRRKYNGHRNIGVGEVKGLEKKMSGVLASNSIP
jgi:hypothetical protein